MGDDPAVGDEVAQLQEAGEDRGRALADLLGRHRPRLLRMVELRMDRHLKARVGASDVLQDAYLEISSRLGDYLADPRMPFFLWVRFITAQNLARLYRFHVGAQKRDVRRQVVSAHPHLPGATTVALVNHLVATGISPTGAAVRGEMRMQLAEALDQLKPEDREVLVLRHFEELSNAETARELGIKEDAASKRYLRALERLRGALMPGGSDA